MPNWCSTAIKFYSKDKDRVDEMYKKFLGIIKGEPTQENDFKNGWMGDFANTFFPELGAEKIECRGWVDGMDEPYDYDEYRVFTMWTETAWGPKIAIWNEIVEKFYPEVKIAYIAEECWCGVFCKWDDDGMFYPDEYYVDICYPDKNGEIQTLDDHYQFGSVQEIQKWLDENMGLLYEHTDKLSDLETEVQSVLDAYSEEHDTEEALYCQIEEFESVAPSEFTFLE